MKKLAILTLMPILLAGCNKGGSSSSDVTYKDLKIMAPKGAPAIALSAFSDLKGFDTNKDPSIIQSMMVNEQIDVPELALLSSGSRVKRPTKTTRLIINDYPPYS